MAEEMVDLVVLAVVALAILVWLNLRNVNISERGKEVIGFGILFFALAFIVASRDPVLITIAMLFLAMKVLTKGAKPPKRFEDGVTGKWFSQYP